MKFTVLALTICAVSLSACNRGPSAQKQNCQTALAQAQRYVTFSAGQLIQSHRSNYSNVATAFRGGSVPRGLREGTLVIETNAPAYATEAQYLSSTVTNLYCI